MKWSAIQLEQMTELFFNDFLEEGQTVEAAVARVIYEMEEVIEKNHKMKILVYNQLNQLSQRHGVKIPYLIEVPDHRKKRGTNSTKQLKKELEKSKMVV